MSKIIIKCRLILIIISVGICTHIRSQSYFKEYIDSEENCGEFNNQVFIKNDSLFLINFISCDSSPYYTNILQYDLTGKFIKKNQIHDLVPNVYSAHLIGDDLFIAGVNSDINPDSKLSFWYGDLDLGLSNTSMLNLFDTIENVFLNTMGSVGIDSNKVIYGQYSFNNNPKVFSFLLWLKSDLTRDTFMVFDSTFDWSIVSDAKVDPANNLIILADAAKVIDHVVYNYRVIQKYNADKTKTFEWISQPFGVNESLPSFTLLDSTTLVLEFVSVENGHILSLIAINQKKELVWEYIFHIDDPKSLYRINDIITCKDGGILCCGTYRNVSENTIETGYVCKLDRNGNLLWERIFYDQEELNLPESGINKIIQFNSIAEGSNHSIVIGGRVIHNFLSVESKSDIFLAVLDSSGCISNICSTFNDITSINEFVNPGKTWTEGYFDSNESWSFKYKFDTTMVVFSGKIYHQLLKAYSEFSESWESTGIFIREENDRLYQYSSGPDHIIYDFNLVKDDTFHLGNEVIVHDLVVENVDTVTLLNGDLKRRLTLQPIDPADPDIDNTVIWIESIGNLAGLMANHKPWSIDGDNSIILCVYLNNTILYDNPNVDPCWVMTTSTNELKKDDLIVMPNPATNDITIVGLDHGMKLLKIYNYLGVQVFSGSEDHISISGFPQGFYFMVAQLKDSRLKFGGFVKL
ncbi:MAG TPA: hypothetical protein VFG10_16870 [Saprospiraceae bacterium]|nr:hypothetical protein [Saprospiraceae bacterium]